MDKTAFDLGVEDGIKEASLGKKIKRGLNKVLPSNIRNSWKKQVGYPAADKLMKNKVVNKTVRKLQKVEAAIDRVVSK